MDTASGSAWPSGSGHGGQLRAGRAQCGGEGVGLVVVAVEGWGHLAYERWLGVPWRSVPAPRHAKVCLHPARERRALVRRQRELAGWGHAWVPVARLPEERRERTPRCRTAQRGPEVLSQDARSDRLGRSVVLRRDADIEQAKGLDGMRRRWDAR